MVPQGLTTYTVLVEETGISGVTLYHWRKQARARGLVEPGDGRNPENWSSEDKFAVVLETAALNEAEVAQYYRKKGLFTEQVVAWKEKALAETAALLVLRKKMHAIWGEDEDK